MADTDQPCASEGRQQRGGQFGRAGGDQGARSAWHGAGWIIGHDGKARRVEPRIRLLAHGVSGRVGKLRAYGNAIVPEVAAEVIGAYLDTVTP
jgi:DNA (cytosine-5)-methyltransferase 1